MNNDKLLRALIDALGFDIEEVNRLTSRDFIAVPPGQVRIYPPTEYKLVKRVDNDIGERLGRYLRIREIEAGIEKSKSIPLVDNFCLSDESLAFLKSVDGSWEFLTGCADIEEAWATYKKTDCNSFDEWIEYASSVVQNLRDRGMLPSLPKSFESKKDIDDIDWKILGFAGRIEAFECFSKSKHVKAFHSFDDWLEWIRQSKISLSLSR